MNGATNDLKFLNTTRRIPGAKQRSATTMKYLCILISILPLASYAQTFQAERASIPVKVGDHQLQFPWNGGYNTLGIGMTDIDGDGDSDLLLTGRDESRLVFYRNDGAGDTGEFSLANESLNGLEFTPGDNRLAFEDIDADGDPDLFVGGNDGRLRFFRNDGGPSDPSFSLTTAFFDSIDVGNVSSAAFGDLNNDGRRDLVVGSYREGFFYYTRTASGPPDFAFVDTLRDAGGDVLKPGSIFYVPSLVDIDADGDLDLFAGSSDQGLAFFRNEGTPSAPQFALVDASFVEPPDYIEGFLTPTFVDIDGDLDFDLFTGSNNGVVSFYRNDGSQSEPLFVLVSPELQLDFLDFGFYTKPTLVDIDADGDLDLFATNETGKFSFLENVGSSTEPSFRWITDNFGGVAERLRSGPTWGDLDADGDFDLLIGRSGGKILVFENTGTAEAPAFDPGVQLKNASDEAITETRPQLVDIDADGDLDLFVSAYLSDGLRALLMYENVGGPTAWSYASTPDSVRDEAGQVITDYDFFHFLADFDGDADPDLFIGNADGKVVFYENVGSPESASFSSEPRFLDPIQTGSNERNIPCFVDIDGDGDLDAFVGRFQGGLFFYRNVGEATATEDHVHPATAALELDQNYPNPFHRFTTIQFRLSNPSATRVRVFDLLGREVKLMDLGTMPGGVQTVHLDARKLSSGVYIYRVEAGGSERAARMVIMN